jgi:hypothetical protein
MGTLLALALLLVASAGYLRDGAFAPAVKLSPGVIALVCARTTVAAGWPGVLVAVDSKVPAGV